MQNCRWIGVWIVVMVLSCTFTRKVSTGLQAFEVRQYAVAIPLFEKEYAASKSQQEKAQLAFLAGESYSKLNDQPNAASWYFKAHQDGYGPEALAHYAEAQKQQEKYEEAIRAYEDLLKSSPTNAAYRSGITLCRQAMEWKKNPVTTYDISPASFNSTAADYAVQPIGPGEVLFTSDRMAKQGEENYMWTGRAYSDLFIYHAASNQVSLFDDRINSEENEGTAIISPDGSRLVFTRCYADDTYDAWCKLMISHRQGSQWSEPEPFPFVKEKVNYGQPAFAANGTTLFFSSDAPEGEGGHDIYFTQSNETGEWSTPVNLGPMINTPGEEQYPTVYRDTLFFSSDHLAGLGGLDIFKTYLDRNNLWVSPINVRAPINSGGDDFCFVVDTFAAQKKGVLMSGYFTSSRRGASQNDDIFAYTLKGSTSADTTTDKPKEDISLSKPVDYQLFLSLRVTEPEYEIKDDPNSTKTGKRPLPNGPVIVSDGVTEQRFTTDNSGQTLLPLEWDKQYVFTAKYRDHLTATYSLNTAEIEKKETSPITTITHIIDLDPIFRNKEIVLENIFYDYDQWVIRDDATPALDKLATILKNNPAIRIQLSSHTDCRGTEEYNLELSQKRAQAAIEYLISVGISATRLVAQGFGESSPAVNCVCENCTEEEHQTNRRTTFKIID